MPFLLLVHTISAILCSVSPTFLPFMHSSSINKFKGPYFVNWKYIYIVYYDFSPQILWKQMGQLYYLMNYSLKWNHCANFTISMCHL